MPDKLYLFDHPVSSYSMKVRMALRHKGLDFTAEIPKNLGSGDKVNEFEQANIRMEVPALVDGDFRIFESTAIVMYLEDKWPEPTLLPSSPRNRAEVRMIEEICDSVYEAINWAVGEINWFKRAEGAEAERLLAAAKKQTGVIQEWLTGKLGQKMYFNGEQVGYGDYCVAPILNRSVQYGFGPDSGPLREYYERVKDNPVIGKTFEEMIAGAKVMANSGLSTRKNSGFRREYRDHRLEFMIKNGAIGIVQKGLEDDNIRFSWPKP